jgi:hypothetical protein
VVEGDTLRELPIQSLKRSFLHWITNDSAIVQSHQRMCSSKTKFGFSATVLHIYKLLFIGRALVTMINGTDARKPEMQNVHQTTNTLQDQIFGGDSSRLVETADIDPAGQRNTERLSAENSC